MATTPAGRIYIADTNNSTIDLIFPAAPVSSSAPTVSGTTTSGQTLTADPGTWTNDPVIYTYQWEDCDASGANCVAITGATSTTYTLTASDAGHTIRVTVTAENGGGSTTATSAPSAAVSAAPTTPTTTPTTPTTGTTPTTPSSPSPGVDETTAGQNIKSLSAVLAGVVASHETAVTYRFQYGSSRRYGKLTANRPLGPSPASQTVTASIRRLIPGSVYHYRLAVTDSHGTVNYGADKALWTPRSMPRRVRDHIYHYWAPHAPYRYQLHGRMVLRHGLSHRVACRTHGYAIVTITHGKTIMARHRAKLTAACTYTTRVSFTAAQLHGSGRMYFHMRFTGNRQLRARPARTLKVLYGPRSQM